VCVRACVRVRAVYVIGHLAVGSDIIIIIIIIIIIVVVVVVVSRNGVIKNRYIEIFICITQSLIAFNYIHIRLF